MKRGNLSTDATEGGEQRLIPRLLSRKQAAEYCCLSPRSFSDWVAKRRLPPPLPQTARWDLRAIDQAIDRMSGVSTDQPLLLDAWRANRARRQTQAR